jgi:hypothetical protein
VVLATAGDSLQARLHDVVLFDADDRAALAALTQRADLPQAAFDAAAVVHTAVADEALEADLLQQGVQAIVVGSDTATLLRVMRHACGAAALSARPAPPTPPTWPPACRTRRSWWNT